MLNPRKSGCPFIHIHTASTNRDVVATGLTEAGDIVIAPSRMSLYQSTFGEQRRSIGTLCVDSMRSSHALSLLMGAFYFAHVTARTIGDGYCAIAQGDLCFCRVLPYLHNALHVTSGHRNTTASALPGTFLWSHVIIYATKILRSKFSIKYQPSDAALPLVSVLPRCPWPTPHRRLPSYQLRHMFQRRGIRQ